MNSNPYREKSSLLLPGFYAAVLSFFLSVAGPARVAAEPLAAGMDHSISIDTSGKMWLWGDNSKGQLATEDLENKFSPSPFRESTDWLMVTAGNHHTVALRNDGTLWSVGSNENGQLGLGLDPLLTPEDPNVDVLTQIGTDTNWTAVSAGGQHTLALKTNGSLWAWGNNTLGQVGNGTTDDVILSPTQVGTATDWSAISSGKFHSLALKGDGELWSWGSNLNDVLGIVTAEFTLISPTQVGTDSDWTTVSAGGTHSLAIKSNDTLWAWGSHSKGQLGLGPLLASRREPEQVGTATDWLAVSAGNQHTLAIRGSGSSGTLWGWGKNSSGQLGLGDVNTVPAVPVQVGSDSDWTSVAAGKNHSLLANSAGDIHSMGNNTRGQLGEPTADSPSASLVGPLLFEDFGPGDPRPDFTISNVVVDSVAQEFTLGQTVTYSLDLNNVNVNTDYLAGVEPLQIQVFLSRDSEFILVDTVEFNDSLLAGASETINDSFVLSQTILQGVYFINFVADGSAVVEEADEGNNLTVTANTFEIFGDPDFQIAAVIIDSQELRPGGEVTFSIDLVNLAGNYPSSATSVPIQVTLSTDAVLGNFDDLTVGTIFLFTGIGSGETKTVTGTLFLPSGIQTADYTYIFSVNPSSELGETDFENNVLEFGELFSFAPDFSFTGVGLPTDQLFPGDDLSFSFTVTNTGADHPADTVVDIELVLTTNEIIGDGDDFELGVTAFSDGIVFGASITVFDTLTIPRNVPSGVYFVQFRVNSNVVPVDEISSDNNLFVASREFRFLPDFVVTEVLIPDTDFAPNSEVGFKITAQNQGSDYVAGGNDPLAITVHLTQDLILDEDDVVLAGTIEKTGDILDGEFFTDSLGYVVPSSVLAGVYFVAATVDATDVTDEIDEANNTFFSQVAFDLRSDLEILGFTFTPAPGGIGRGANFIFSDITLVNNGDFDLPAGTEITLELRLSLDRLYGDINDVLLITDYTITLPVDTVFAAGATLEVVADVGGEPFALTIPTHTPTGNYHVAARVDLADTIPEVNEDNNIFFSADDDTFVVGATLGEAIEDHLTVGNRENYQPLLGGVSSWYGQDVVFNPDDIGITAGQTGPIEDGEESYFELQITVLAESELLFSWMVDSEAGFDFLSFTLNGDEVPEVAAISGEGGGWLDERVILSIGTHLVRFSYAKDGSTFKGADTGYVDTLEINPIGVVEGAPDFILENIFIDKAGFQLSPVEVVDFEITLRNQGADFLAGNDPLIIELRLSADNLTFDAGDTLIGTAEFEGNLTANSSVIVAGSFQIAPSTPVGNFFIAFKVDPGGLVPLEIDSNNTAFTNNPFEVLSFPDLFVLNVNIVSIDPRPGQDVTIEVIIGNQGDDLPFGAQAITTEIRLTIDETTGNADDVVIDSFSLNAGISSGTSISSDELTFTFPSDIDFGDYRFAVTVDSPGNIEEDDEDNNSFLTPAGTPFTFSPDFEITSVSVPDVDLLPGDNLDFTFSVRNNAANLPAGAGSLDTEIILSLDTNFGDPSDVLVTVETRTTGVDFDQSFTVDNSVALPTDISPGEYFVGFRVNPEGALTEVTTDNNGQFSTVTYRIFPDFVITQLLIPSTEFIPGSALGFKVTGLNQGAIHEVEVNDPGIVVGIVLSQDTQFDINDDVILTSDTPITYEGDILNGETRTDSQAYTVPSSVPAGTYFVGATIDSEGSFSEINEFNNSFFSTQSFDLFSDLEVTAVTSTELPGSFARGSTIEISNLTITNNADYFLPAGNEFRVQLRLSKDRIFGNLDDAIIVTEITIDEIIGAGESVSVTGIIAEIPNDTPAGDYFLVVRIDIASEIPETNETNNTLFANLAEVTILGTNGTSAGLAEALEDHAPANPIGISTILGGVSSWYAQTSQVQGGDAAGQSGVVGDGEESYFEFSTFQEASFEISFFWNVSSEASFDFLDFSINDEVIESISGNPVDFVKVTEVLDPGSYTFRWTYRKDSDVSKLLDTGWVDTIEINDASDTPLQAPDFLIVSVEFEPGTFVVQRDSFDFNAIGINIGGDLLPIPSDSLEVEAVLTIDQEIGNSDDILLGSFSIAEPLDESNQFVYRNIILIPETNRAGIVVPASANYFLALRIDPPTVSNPNGNFTELDENNNILISDEANIVVETRPDIALENFTYTNGQFSYGDSILLSFDLINNGLQNIPGVVAGGEPVQMQIVLDNSEFTSFEYIEGLAIGERRFIQLSIAVQDDFPISSSCGNVNVLADTTGVVDESNENNNTTFNTNLDVFITGIDLGEALDAAQLRWVLDGSSSCVPWVGQSEEALDGVDAVKSPATLAEGEFSNLSSTVFIDSPTFVSFAYMGTPVIQIKQGDEIIRLAKLVAPEGAGIWNGFQAELDPGDFYTFTFISGTVILEADLQDGEDIVAAGEEFNAGTGMFIDKFGLSFPEIVLNTIDFTGGAQTLDRGDTIDLTDAVIEIVNIGSKDVPANTPLVFQFRLSTDQVFGDDNDILLRSEALGFLKDTHTVQLDDALVASENPLIPRDVSEFFTLRVSEFTPPGDYFLGIFVNFTGIIEEVDFSNNVLFTDQPVIIVNAGGGVVTLDEALDLNDVVAPVGPLTSTRDLEVPWFGQGDVHNGNGDAAQSPFIDEGGETAFEVPIPGPAEVTFFWKSDTLENLNSLTLLVDGVIEKRISGDVDWHQESVVLGDGDHTLRWVYQKGKNHEGTDVGYIDTIAVNIFDLEVTDITVGGDIPVNRLTSIDGLSVTLTNNGNAAVGAFMFEVLLSLNSEFGDADDVLLGTFELAGGIGASSDVTLISAAASGFDLVVPITANPGVYTVVVNIDSANAINEVDEANNIEFDLDIPNTVTVNSLSLANAMDASGDLAPATFIIGGDGSWYGLSTAEGLDAADNTNDDDAGKAPNLNTAGQTAFFEASIPGPFRLFFEWKVFSAGDTLSLSIDSVEVASIIGTDGFTTIDLNIQAGSTDRLVRWTYTRNNDGDDDPAEKAFVDNLLIEALTLPDLIITSLEFSDGTFVIQANTPFDVTVVGVNAGVPMSDNGSSTGSQLFDVEIRLSLDKIWGNSDDVILGKLNEIEQIDDNGRFVFTQSWILSNPYAEGDYFVAAFVDSTEIFEEFDEANNFSFSESADVTLDLRPNLRIQNLTYRTGSYYKNGEIQLEFDVVNTGFEDFPIGESFQITIDMKGQYTDTFDDGGVDVQEITEQTNLDRTLVTFSDDRGIRADLTGLNPPSVTFSASLKLPAYNESDITDDFPVFSDLTVDDPNTTGTTGNESPISIFFALDTNITSNDVAMVSGSSITFLGSHNINILARPFSQSFSDFITFWNNEPDQGSGITVTGDTDEDLDGDGFNNLQEFAFGMDPRESNSQPAFDDGDNGLNPGPTFGLIQIDGEEYLSVTFNRLDNFADGEDLDYVVEVSENGTFDDAIELIRIDSTDTIDIIESDTETVSVTDNDYLHRITIKDTIPINATATRFIRVVVIDN